MSMPITHLQRLCRISVVTPASVHEHGNGQSATVCASLQHIMQGLQQHGHAILQPKA